MARAPYRKRDEVREQILEAAEQVLAERAPSEVSVRDIAERAGVQHSLVHRHFTSKDALVAEVVRRTIDGYAEAVRDHVDPAEAFVAGMTWMADHRSSFAALTRTLMDAPADVDVPRFPGFDEHLRRLAPDIGRTRGRPRVHGDGRVDSRVLIVTLLALTSGWAFLEDRWLETAGFSSRDRTAVRRQVATIIGDLIERESPND
jgi:TetR/AcrR family transcriptional regulator, repressor for neighboring sulfatase